MIALCFINSFLLYILLLKEGTFFFVSLAFDHEIFRLMKKKKLSVFLLHFLYFSLAIVFSCLSFCLLFYFFFILFTCVLKGMKKPHGSHPQSFKSHWFLKFVWNIIIVVHMLIDPNLLCFLYVWTFIFNVSNFHFCTFFFL